MAFEGIKTSKRRPTRRGLRRIQVSNLKEYQHHLSDIVKFLIPYGKTKNPDDKTIVVIAYDESEQLDSRTFAMGDPDVIGHLSLSLIRSLPEEIQVHLFAHLVNDHEDVLLDLMELKEHGELPMGDE